MSVSCSHSIQTFLLDGFTQMWQIFKRWYINESYNYKTPASLLLRQIRIIWSSRPRYWYYQYCNIYNTGITSIIILQYQYCNVTILVIPVSYIYNTGCTSIVHLQYWNTRIVDLYTILEAPVFFIQQYW